VRRGSEDKLRWAPSKIGLSKVKSFYCSLGCSEGSCFPWKSVWRTKIPLRAAFSMWSATLGKILTMDNLKKWHVIVVDRCCMCKRNEGSVAHLLYCDMAYAIWIAFFQSFWIVLGYA
jgi:hypothetical protein